jgi:hypothetical protein
MLLSQPPPFPTLAVQVPLLQNADVLQGFICTVVHAPAPLHAVADKTALRSAEQVAAVQLVVEPGYPHVSDDPLHVPAHFAEVAVQAA